MRQVHRSTAGRVGAWIVIVFVVANLVDIAVQGRDFVSLAFAAGLILAAALAYVVGLRPAIVADEDGVVLRNPLRDVTIPWDALEGVTSGDAIRVHCADDGPTFRSFILQSSPRSRAKADARAMRDARKKVGGKRGGRAPNGLAEAVAGRTAADYVVEQIADAQNRHRLDKQTAERARARTAEKAGAAAPAVKKAATTVPPAATVTWSWPAIWAVVIPAVLTVITVTIANV